MIVVSMKADMVGEMPRPSDCKALTRAACAAGAVATWLASGMQAHAGEAFMGLYAHDVKDKIALGGHEHGAEVVAGVKTTALDELAFLRRPRLRLLGGVNTKGGLAYLAA